MIQSSIVRSLFFRVAVALSVLMPAGAWATPQIYPPRVLLSDAKRVTYFTLRNKGDKPDTFEIDAIFYRMKEDGTLEEAPSDPGPAEHSIAKMLRFTPREVALGPNGDQIIRVVFTGPRNLPEGDYLAHMRVTPQAGGEDSTVTTKKDKVSATLKMRTAIAIPVLFKRGKPKIVASISKLALTQTPEKRPAFSAEMESTGNALAFGNLYVTFTPTGGEAKSVATIRGVATYLKHRTVLFPFNEAEGTTIAHGKLRVEWWLPEEDGSKKALIGAAEADVP